MSRPLIQSILFSLSLVWIGCADTRPLRDGGSQNQPALDSSEGSNLQLSWSSQSGVAVYHVFYTDGKQAREIDSLPDSDEDFANPKMIINDTNMESWPAQGQRACFYVTADNGVLNSDPSEKACIVL